MKYQNALFETKTKKPTANVYLYHLQPKDNCMSDSSSSDSDSDSEGNCA